MKDRPILLNGPMVRATLAELKDCTRRVVKHDGKPLREDMAWQWRPQPSRPGQYGPVWENWWDVGNGYAFKCPYGQPGDQLWVREAFGFDNPAYLQTYKEEPWRGDPDPGNAEIVYRATTNPEIYPKGFFKPSIHMPRWASRITLEVTGVRVERLHDITEEDAWSEGVALTGCAFGKTILPSTSTGRERFQALWESINGPGSWESNLWVWVIEFRRVQP